MTTPPVRAESSAAFGRGAAVGQPARRVPRLAIRAHSRSRRRGRLPEGGPGSSARSYGRHAPLPAAGRARRAHDIRRDTTALVAGGDLLALLGAAWLTASVDGTTVVSLGLFFALCSLTGVYRARLSLSVLDDTPGLVGRLIGAVAVAGVAFPALNRGHAPDPRSTLVRLAAGIIALLVVRAATFAAVRSARAKGRFAQPLLLIGAGRVGGGLAEALLAHPEYGLTPKGFYDPNPRPGAPTAVKHLPTWSNLAEALRASRAEVAIVAFSSLREDRLVEVLRTCDRLSIEIYQVPRLYELSGTGRGDADTIWGTPVVKLKRAAHRSPTWRFKRVLDVVVAATALVAAAPLLVLCFLAVRLDGGPGVIFRQERVGIDGRRFSILKFRSLRPATSTESATNWNIAQDSRLSKVGALLRKSSLDELPQLWNVIRGDMSLVGPRPERPHFVGRFGEHNSSYGSRHRVPSGLTGWAQIHGLRGDTSIAHRANFDNFYVEHWSLWSDCKIILRTFAAIFTKRGA